MSVLSLLRGQSKGYLKGSKLDFDFDEKKGEVTTCDDDAVALHHFLEDGEGSKTLNLLKSVNIPASVNGVWAPHNHPQLIKDDHKCVGTFIVQKWPTKEKPVVIIRETAKGERYDSLLMIHRDDSVGPLIVALDFKQSKESFEQSKEQFQKEPLEQSDGDAGDLKGNVFRLDAKCLKQQRATTEYFRKLKLKKSLKFDFAYLFISSREGHEESDEIDVYVVRDVLRICRL